MVPNSLYEMKSALLLSRLRRKRLSCKRDPSLFISYMCFAGFEGVFRSNRKENDPFLKFIDRWCAAYSLNKDSYELRSTNGGLLLGAFIGIALGLGLEKLLELFMDWTKAPKVLLEV